MTGPPLEGPTPMSGLRGFTIVELAMVLVLAGILMSVMAPVLEPGRWRADSAVHELTLSLNAAQRLAMMRQHDVVVTFEIPKRRVRVLQDQDNDGVADDGEDQRVIELPETIGFGLGGAPALSQGPAPVSFRDTGQGPSVTFHRNGSASETGAAYLHPYQGSLSGNDDGVRALTVERATGEVRCYSYRTGSWEAAC